MKKISKTVFVLFLLWTLICGLWTIDYELVYAEIPHLINYQGRLTDTGGVPLNGAYNLNFKIYDAETAGNLLWEETQAGVVVNKGIFAVLLGSVTNLNLTFDKPYFLEIKVGNEVMNPRQRITSAGYAIRAEHGVPKGVIVMWSGSIAEIPSGWVLCDGTNKTPDLRDRFVVGARQDETGVAKTNVTGSLTQNGDGQIPSHNHDAGVLAVAPNGSHTHNVPAGLAIGSDTRRVVSGEYLLSGNVITDYQGNHTHNISGSTANAGSGVKNIATYYALAFIMKSE